MIHVVDQRVRGLWQVAGLKSAAGPPPLRPAAPDGGLAEPWGASPSGRTMAVADAGNDRIALVDLDSGDTVGIDTSPSPIGPLKGPRGVAVTGDGTLVVADTGNHRIAWSTSTVADIVAGGAAGGWTAYGQASVDGSHAPGDFLAPTSVCVDADGRTWVSDPGLGRVAVVEGAGVGWSEVTLPPRPDGVPRQPYAVARADTHVLVSDLTSGEIWQVDADLVPSLLVAGRTKDRLTAPVAICAEARGFVVADAVGARIVRWSRDRTGRLRYRGELAARGRPPGAPVFTRVTGLAVTGAGR